jgi:hypothetical protein
MKDFEKYEISITLGYSLQAPNDIQIELIYLAEDYICKSPFKDKSHSLEIMKQYWIIPGHDNYSWHI